MKPSLARTSRTAFWLSFLIPAALTLCCFAFAGCYTQEQLLFSRGEEEMKRLQYAEAYQTFTRFLELEPNSSSAYYNRALALVGLGRRSEALDDLDQAARLNPTNTDARWMRFRIESVLRDAAQRDTTVSPAQRPLKEGLESMLAVSMMGELDKILEVDRYDIQALNERGRLKHERGEYDEALKDYSAALVLCDTCTWILYNKALTLKANWQTREALVVLNDLIDINSSDGEAWLLLGECLFGLGRRRDACKAFQRSMELGVAEAEERFATLCE